MWCQSSKSDSAESQGVQHSDLILKGQESSAECSATSNVRVSDPVLKSPLSRIVTHVSINSILMQYNLNTAFPPLFVEEI